MFFFSWKFAGVEKLHGAITIQFQGRIFPMTVTISVDDAKKLSSELNTKLS